MDLKSQWAVLPRPVQIAVASITAFSATILAGTQAWPTVEPYFLAHRAYARSYADDKAAELTRRFEPTRSGMYDIQISIAESRRSQIVDRIITLEIDAPKSENTAELITRRQQIAKLREEQAHLEASIKLLYLQREKN